VPNDNDAIEKAEAVLAGIGGVLGGLVEAFNRASRELAELKADLKAKPTIDSSASDAEAAATAEDMPDE